jgi:hypothetical protein
LETDGLISEKSSIRTLAELTEMIKLQMNLFVNKYAKEFMGSDLSENCYSLPPKFLQLVSTASFTANVGLICKFQMLSY